VSAPTQAAKLAGRFSFVRTLGSGGFGHVIEAWDHVQEAPVALKNLHSVDPASLYAFKQEFRSLADVRHPNLARLHELFNAEGDWWLVMELIVGVSFREWTSGSRSSAMSLATFANADTLPSSGNNVLFPPTGNVPDKTWPEDQFDESRLRGALPQLIAGVHALHEAGKLHRDLKPSNVLVTSAGRVVILDFGLVAELDGGQHRTLDPRIKGTPAYMAPEQIMTQPLTPAADWYAIGVMLYEVLRGKHPFGGNINDILINKVSRDAIDPRLDRPNLPADLVELSLSLLARDAEARPTGAQLLEKIGVAPKNDTAAFSTRDLSGPTRPALTPSPGRLELVGREKELGVLANAWVATRAGQPHVVRISGRSGLGKTALVRHFVDGLEPEAVMLAGRCYERETVPYKAFDGIVDALTQYLRALPAADADRFVPRDARALARVFPVYGRLASSISGREAAVDAPELRRRAFAALREVLSRIADAHPLVLWIDDLHFGDLDSAALLADLLSPPDPPALLLIASYRSEDADSPLVLALGSLPARELELGPLQPEDARTLAVLLSARNEAENVARESGGSPLFIEALARRAHAGGAPRALSLQTVVSESIRELESIPRRVLSAVAAAGGPIAQDVLRKSVGIGGEEGAEAESVLRSARLIRTVTRGNGRDVDVLHQVVRDAVLAELDAPALTGAQRALAEAAESLEGADPETVARLFRSAGDLDRARPFAVRAADRAADALAFDQAAALYQVALDPPPLEGAQALRIRLAEALANGGRGALAAQAFLDAVPGANNDEVMTLERRAAETLLRAGHIDQGIEVVTRVLDHLGSKLPASPLVSLASLLYHRARLRLRGYDYESKQSVEVDPRTLARIDVCWSIGNGFGGVDLIRAADFHARHILLALDTGEPYRIARAFSWEAILGGLEGASEWSRAAMLTERAEAIAQEIAHPHALAWAVSATAVTSWCRGKFRQSVHLCEYAVSLFRERCADIGWEMGSLEFWWLQPALWYLGETDTVARRAPAALKEASERGDLYAVTTARTNVTPRLLLLADRGDEALREADDAIAQWSSHGYHLQHWTHLIAACEADLYQQKAASARDRLDRAWPSLTRAQHLRSVVVRCVTHDLRGRVYLALGEEKRALAEASVLDKTRVPWSAAAATAIRAGVQSLRGQKEEASVSYTAASSAFERAELTLHAAATARRAAELVNARAAIAPADASLLARGVANVESYARFLAPGA
jgi:serine/threonine protein kinase